MRQFFIVLGFLSAWPVFSQIKKPIEHADVHRWRKVEQTKITPDGRWVAWSQVAVTEGDPVLYLWNSTNGTTTIFPRSTDAVFSDDSRWLVFRTKPALDSLKALRRKKVKDEDLPKDTLGIYELATGKWEKTPRLKSFSIPEKWSGWLAFQIETEKPSTAPKDTTGIRQDTSKTGRPPAKTAGGKSAKKPKKEDKDNGYRLLVQNLATGTRDTFAYVKEFTLAKRGPRLLLHSTGRGDTLTFRANPRALQNGVYLLDLEKNHLRPLLRAKGKFQQLSLDESGTQAAFLADLDTSLARIRPWQLAFWESKQDSATLIAGPKSAFLPKSNPKYPESPFQEWNLSEHARPVFSEDAGKLYFGMAPPPVLNDTTLLKEEIVEVEVWTWTDKRMYTQEEIRLENEKKRAYTVVYHTGSRRFVPLGTPEIPELRFEEKRNSNLALGIAEEPYAQHLTWEGAAHKDLYAVNLETGDKKLIVRDLRCNPRISPLGKYILWWSDPDTAWFSWNARTAAIKRLTDNRRVAFYDEDTDVPDYPGEHGLAAWLENDAAVLLYDRYDIWKVDPAGLRQPEQLTRGRETKTTFRYIKLDPEARHLVVNERILLHTFNENDKTEGYAWLPLNNLQIESWAGGDYVYSRTPLKARTAEALVFSRENYHTFPDLQYLEKSGSTPLRISNANPQQTEYRWGNIEMVEWTSLSGEKIKGLLVKPEDFDPTKQYPMIVNFYEKLSGELHRHRSPDFHRSQINYTVYASRGYLVFAPDIPYRIGYPGESAYDAIMSGVTHLIAKGFVDSKRIALQGHSWGGYQAAYLVTRTHLFACAEAGAPVANMTSAYGGIRWESGLSRSFQYERQQSRIGGSLWEKPKQYVENSPLFALDKVETPLLIMHNDKDGAVPWYQGIELFNGLRRLNKPAWLLNYNDEPHWPVKLQNRIDFQRRMQQFFDHYLLAAPAPRWMTQGVSPIEKGILQGY